MTTENISTIKSSGGDYSSLAAWAYDRKGDLVTDDRREIAECYGFADTTSCLLTSSTTDATRCFIIRTAASAKHAGVFSDSVYRLVGANTLLNPNVNNVLVDGIQFDQTATGSYQYAVNISAYTGIVFNGIIMRCAAGSNTRVRGISVGNAGAGVTIRNSIGYGFTGTSSACILSDPNATLEVENCTVYGCERGYSSAGTNFTVKNCIAQSCTDGFYGSFNAASDYNISNVAADAPGSHSQNGVTVSFVDATNKDFHLAPTDTVAIGHGVDLSALFTTDIDGEMRTTPWDVGADQYVAAGGYSGSIDIAWAVLNHDSTDLAWAVLNASSRDIAWAVKALANASVAWAVLNAMSRDLAWAVLMTGQGSIDLAWAVLGRDSRVMAWSVLNSAGQDTGWSVLAVDSLALAWKVLGKAQQDLGWAVLNAEDVALAWGVESDLVPEPIKVFLAEGRKVLFSAQARQLIFLANRR